MCVIEICYTSAEIIFYGGKKRKKKEGNENTLTSAVYHKTSVVLFVSQFQPKGKINKIITRKKKEKKLGREEKMVKNNNVKSF